MTLDPTNTTLAAAPGPISGNSNPELDGARRLAPFAFSASVEFRVTIETMKNRVLTAVVLAALTFSSASLFGANNPANWRSQLLEWRAKRAKNLTAPEGWMSLVGLEWLKQGDNTVGAAAGNSIVLKKSAPHLAIFKLHGQQVMLAAPVGGFPKELTVDGHAAQNGQTIAPDDSANPTKLKIGTLTILVIHRGDKYGVRIKDSQSPTITGFHGLKWYPPDLAYRVKAKWIPYNPPKQKPVPTILGTTENMVVPGVAEFMVQGKSYRLEPVLEEPGDKQLFFIMRDATSASTTYGAARFLYTDFPDHGLTQPGELWIDFNRAQNPPCAYTPYATCPLPPPENRLKVAIPAGEKRYSH